MNRQYLCIDLKSFYASVECVERGLDPMTASLVVADPERSEKTICLAVSPALKARGVSGRARVFEIPESFDYIMAVPRMRKYVEYSAEIYGIYLRYFSKDDIHVYSIDEAFMDVTGYLPLYGCTARELGERIRAEVLEEVGIPATCGIGPNLYLAKLSLDITAKHSPDFFGELDADSFKAQLWDHEPLTDFWRIGRGTERRLHELGIQTMGQLALYPDLGRLYDAFGIDAEILIDHAWGYEPVGIADIKAYEPKSRSATNAQVLPRPYDFDDALIVAKEMADASALDLVAKKSVAGSVTLAVRYTREAGSRAPGPYDPADRRNYTADAGGTRRFDAPTNSRTAIVDAVVGVFRDAVDHDRLIHNIMLNFNGVEPEGHGQLSLFDDAQADAEERSRQEAILDVKRKLGKNALVKGIDLMPQATQRDRNRQLGGHKSGDETEQGGASSAARVGPHAKSGRTLDAGAMQSAAPRARKPFDGARENGPMRSDAHAAPPMRDAEPPALSRPRMPLEQRAKIFIPFDPLKGYKEALREKERQAEAAHYERVALEEAP